MSFVHLHVHTEHSFMNSTIRIRELIRKAQELDMPAVAITDSCSMGGAIEFYRTAKGSGINPIIGAEVSINHHRHPSAKDSDEHSFHLRLLAKDNEGYKNLLQIVSHANIEGSFPQKAVDMNFLAAHSKGLIGLSAGLNGDQSACILKGDFEEAEKALREFAALFGKDNFFIEIMDHGIDGQKALNRRLIELSRSGSIPLVATNSVHYLNRENSLAHDVQICIRTEKSLNALRCAGIKTDEKYFKSSQEMQELFSDIPEALLNTLEIAGRCKINLDLSTWHLPHFPVGNKKTADSLLREICLKEIQKRVPEPGEKYNRQMEYELSIICDRGLSPYFLIIWDFISSARSKAIPVGPGRGAAASSLVAYLLGITEVDPLQYSLIFERFINPAGKSIPDISIDICLNRRDEALDHLRAKYGRDHVAEIASFERFDAAAAIRDCGRVLEIPFQDCEKLEQIISSFYSISEFLRTDEGREIRDREEPLKQLLDTAKTIESLIRSSSVHPHRVTVSKEPLDECMPLQKIGDTIAAQYDYISVSEAGFLTIAVLGLRTLTVIGECLKMIKADKGAVIDLEHLPMDDPLTFKILQHGDTTGIFQLESRLMRKYLRRLKPESFEDLAALCALFRPDSIKHRVLDGFIKRKNGDLEAQYPGKELEHILKTTHGVIVYQEQVMKIAQECAGFTMAQADDLRKSLGMKNALLPKWQERFLEGAAGNGVDRKTAGKIWKFVLRYAPYTVNKSHIAAYAMISYRTAFLKAHYPVEYMNAIKMHEPKTLSQ